MVTNRYRLTTRDFVVTYYHPDDIDNAIADFATRVTEAFQIGPEGTAPLPTNLLEQINLGASSAEVRPEDAILLPEIVDTIFLVAIHPASQGQHFR